MIHEFDYYGNLIKYMVDHDVDGTFVEIIDTEVEPEDEAEKMDIEFHCKMDYSEKAEAHYLKTGTYLD